ncbi:hypothetical protein [Bacillus sp. 7884-1]|uniref:hypothetical protein n=1 Tax=Bacillus sp. 7884-1 TaxID=2021693 RepID=UPI000BA5CF93|nr:hypothetical protein [Bacillus sp. 7884-1]PAE35433.1 hypothetical protein CHI06_23580 [Bacillus sp. 7884-1]
MFDKRYLYYGLIVLLFPVALNFILFQFNSSYAYGDGDVWLGFWGNYSGGVISAIVAYLVANFQIKKQLQLDLSKEKFARRIAQLPSLVRIKLELENYINQLKEVKQERDYFILANGGLKDEDEEEGIEEFEVISKKYKIELLNVETYKFLEKIENDNLHIELITCFKFYDDFSKATSFDLISLENQENQLMEDYVHDYSTVPSVIEQVNHLHLEMQDYFIKKENAWKNLLEKDVITKFENVLSEVEQEINNIKEIKENESSSILSNIN